MKKKSIILSIITFFLFIDIIIAQQANWEWAKSAGGSTDDYGCSMTINSNNELYVTGWFRDTMYVGDTMLISNGQSDIYILKYDSLGNLLNFKQIGSSGYDGATFIYTDNLNNIYLTGKLNGTAYYDTSIINSLNVPVIFISKFNSIGNIEWSHEIENSPNSTGYSITTDIESNVYFIGSFQGVLTIGDTSIISNSNVNYRDVFIIKYSESGIFQWVRKCGSENYTSDDGYSIIADSNNNIPT